MNAWDRELAATLDEEWLRRVRKTRCLCQERGCINQTRTVHRDWQGKDWRFCDRHGRARAVHNRIVERILEIPPR